MKNLKVVIDPGHGGKDPGAVNIKAKEKTINLAIAQKICNGLVDIGITPIMTRYSDKRTIGNTERCKIANVFDADIFVSIHCNSVGSGDPAGYEIIHCPVSVKGKLLAEKIHESFKNSIGIHARLNPVKTDAALNRGFKLTVLWSTKMPAIIIECGFISNEHDRKILKNEEAQQKIADQIVIGLVDFFNC